MPEVRQVDWPGATHGACAIELRTSAVRLVAITHAGPRIAHWGAREGNNLLYWAPGQHARDDWDPLGGHRLWTTRPGADESEETYRPDNDACTASIDARGFTVTAPVEPVTRLQRGFSVRALDEESVLVEHYVRNAGDLLWSGGLWSVTVTAPGASTRYAVPLSDGSRWDCATVVLFSQWAGGHGTASYDDPQFTFTHDAMVLSPQRRENKRMLEARPGVLAMHDPVSGVLYAKHAAYVANASYPRGANLALYTGGAHNFYVELETMSPMGTLRPGESLRHCETWLLRQDVNALPSGAQLRSLFATPA